MVGTAPRALWTGPGRVAVLGPLFFLRLRLFVAVISDMNDCPAHEATKAALQWDAGFRILRFCCQLSVQGGAAPPSLPRESFISEITATKSASDEKKLLNRLLDGPMNA